MFNLFLKSIIYLIFVIISFIYLNDLQVPASTIGFYSINPDSWCVMIITHSFLVYIYCDTMLRGRNYVFFSKFDNYLLLILLLLCGYAVTDNLFVFFFCYEVIVIVTFYILMHPDNPDKNLKSTVVDYFFKFQYCAILVFSGIFILYILFSITNISQLLVVKKEVFNNGYFTLAMFLLFLGFVLQVFLCTSNLIWVAACCKTNTGLSIYLNSVLTKVILYGFSKTSCFCFLDNLILFEAFIIFLALSFVKKILSELTLKKIMSLVITQTVILAIFFIINTRVFGEDFIESFTILYTLLIIVFITISYDNYTKGSEGLEFELLLTLFFIYFYAFFLPTMYFLNCLVLFITYFSSSLFLGPEFFFKIFLYMLVIIVQYFSCWWVIVNCFIRLGGKYPFLKKKRTVKYIVTTLILVITVLILAALLY